MNLRILKKLSKRAVKILCERHGYKLGDFTTANGDETTDVPARGWPRHQRERVAGRSLPFVSLLKGTPLVYRRVSYEHDEWDFRTAFEELRELDFWSSPEADAAIEAMLADEPEDDDHHCGEDVCVCADREG
ncbi:hypothetical protein [Azospirillum sp. ST 5-10]|uniref:hypothetical protein n=1 Tax=unclassified Azospirillum TaxID=2630922 RepID=UPI003F49EB75